MERAERPTLLIACDVISSSARRAPPSGIATLLLLSPSPAYNEEDSPKASI
jgi:hypothetical protein